MQDRRQRGAILLLALVAAAVVLASVGALALAGGAERGRLTERVLAQAREALIAHAAERPIDARVGPGYLPCPDLDGDGWAESTCGSLSGQLGQAERLGILPWKTLGLPDLRDGHGERLWYAVSSRHKGLLNCAASRACVDMTPPSALGTITVRGPSGELLHDGTISDPALASRGGAAAVVIAPGPPLRRRDGHVQQRGCTARCDPRDYLDVAPFEDNARFRDLGDPAARAANSDGFVQGPVRVDDAIAVNDRIAVVAYPQLMARVKARVALEVALCLRNVVPLPAPASACGGSAGLGRLPDEALAGAACNAAADESGWWGPWRHHVLYARAQPGGMEVVDERGRLVATGQRFAVLVTQRPDECAGTIACGPQGCTRATQLPRSTDRHDALVASR